MLPTKILTEYDHLVKRAATIPAPGHCIGHEMQYKGNEHSLFLKKARESIFAEIARFKAKNPSPNLYNPSFSLTSPSILGP